MNSNLRILLGIIFSLFFMTGCYFVSMYSGDGILIDNGMSAAIDRYVLTLDSVDLSRKGTKKYRIANLPVAKFWVGIEVEVEPKDQSLIGEKSINPTVSLKLSDSEGNVIFEKEGELASWSWELRGNKPTLSFIGGTDNGGTHLEPKPPNEYEITFTVLEPYSGQSKISASLKMKSGGWK